MSSNVKAMRAALHDGAVIGTTLSLQSESANKVTSFLEEALRSEHDRIAQACFDARTEAPVHAIGQVAARILTSPLLRVGELRSGQNIQLVREVARHVAIPGHRLEVAVGLGGSVQPPSMRLLAYFTPLLEIGQSFVDADTRPPALRVIAAHEVSSKVNGLDPDIAKHRAEQAGQMLTRLVRIYSRGVGSNLSFEHLSMDDLIKHDLAADAKHIRELIDGTGPHQTTLNKMMRRATVKHANTNDTSAMKRILAAYVAAHGLSFHNYRYPEVHGTIKLGGQGEAPFDQLQQYMAERALKRGEHSTNHCPGGGTRQVSLRMRAGTLPPYYLEADGELTVETTSEEMPDSATNAAKLYEARGLRSGSDFQHLPGQVSRSIKDFLIQDKLVQ